MSEAQYKAAGLYEAEITSTTSSTPKLMMDGIYDIIVIGSGGNGAYGRWISPGGDYGGNRYAAAGGGSGAKLVGTLTLTEPTTLLITNTSGGDATTIKIGSTTIASVPGGGDGSANATWPSLSATAGSGADKSNITTDSTYISDITTTSGSDGTANKKVCTYDTEAGVSGAGGTGHIGRPTVTTTRGDGATAVAQFSGSTSGTAGYGYVLIYNWKSL